MGDNSNFDPNAILGEILGDFSPKEDVSETNADDSSSTDDFEFEYVDEEGNPIDPSELQDQEFEYVDEDGNPIDMDDLGDYEVEFTDDTSSYDKTSEDVPGDVLSFLDDDESEEPEASSSRDDTYSQPEDFLSQLDDDFFSDIAGGDSGDSAGEEEYSAEHSGSLDVEGANPASQHDDGFSSRSDHTSQDLDFLDVLDADAPDVDDEPTSLDFLDDLDAPIEVDSGLDSGPHSDGGSDVDDMSWLDEDVTPEPEPEFEPEFEPSSSAPFSGFTTTPPTSSSDSATSGVESTLESSARSARPVNNDDASPFAAVNDLEAPVAPASPVAAAIPPEVHGANDASDEMLADIFEKKEKKQEKPKKSKLKKALVSVACVAALGVGGVAAYRYVPQTTQTVATPDNASDSNNAAPGGEGSIDLQLVNIEQVQWADRMCSYMPVWGEKMVSLPQEEKSPNEMRKIMVSQLRANATTIEKAADTISAMPDKAHNDVTSVFFPVYVSSHYSIPGDNPDPAIMRASLSLASALRGYASGLRDMAKDLALVAPYNPMGAREKISTVSSLFSGMNEELRNNMTTALDRGSFSNIATMLAVSELESCNGSMVDADRLYEEQKDVIAEQKAASDKVAIDRCTAFLSTTTDKASPLATECADVLETTVSDPNSSVLKGKNIVTHDDERMPPRVVQKPRATPKPAPDNTAEQPESPKPKPALPVEV